MESWSQFTISILSPDNSCCPYYPQSFSLRLSSRIAHSSVQVMITVINLSFTKLLLALFDVFTPVQLYRSNINEPLNIWFSDGSITYGDTNHMKLMIVTSVIVGILLIPYMLIILTGW